MSRLRKLSVQRLSYIFWGLLLSSCGLVSKMKGEPDGTYSWYKRALTSDEKTILDNKGSINKDHIMYDRKGNIIEKGQLFIQKKGEAYNFIETGKWYSTFPKKNALDMKIAQYHIETEYDLKGNKITEKAFLEENADSLIIVEEMSATIDTIDNKPVLLQQWKLYYPNESPQQSFNLASPDFDKPLSDRFKPKYKHGKHEFYNQTGEIKSSKVYHIRDKIKP